MAAGMIRIAQLSQWVFEHMGVVGTLAKGPMHGLMPEREEVIARLSCTDYLASDKLL